MVQSLDVNVELLDVSLQSSFFFDHLGFVFVHLVNLRSVSLVQVFFFFEMGIAQLNNPVFLFTL